MSPNREKMLKLFKEGMTQTGIAKELGVSTGTVNGAVFRMRKNGLLPKPGETKVTKDDYVSPKSSVRTYSIKEQVIELIKQGMSHKDIVAKGFPKGTVSSVRTSYNRSLEAKTKRTYPPRKKPTLTEIAQTAPIMESKSSGFVVIFCRDTTMLTEILKQVQL